MSLWETLHPNSVVTVLTLRWLSPDSEKVPCRDGLRLQPGSVLSLATFF